MTSDTKTPPTSTELAIQRTDLADDRTRLAVTRTVAALDRTLMAWIRTATSLISFGFTIYKFFQALRESQRATEVHHLLGPRAVGLVMIGLGVGSLLWALIDYKAQMKGLHEDYKQYGPFRQSTAAAVATVICGLGHSRLRARLPASMNPANSLSADAALARLAAGNERFVRGRARFPTVQKEVLAELAKRQRPYATIIGCSDSRVPPELVFDAGFGELFIVRVAGNIISPEVMGTLQYAAVHLHTPLFVVLGHEGCGAVQAALAMKFQGARERERITLLLENILPGLRDIDANLAPQKQIKAAVEANVRWSMRQLLETAEGKARMAEGVVKLVGAVYALKTGRVRFLP